ncbi:MAG: apolipoprotein N-acyltransferase [Kiritimatiellae bacterium]|nr:apolipoprotein N-acyltransferase [Kiritimatiellia bacterium]
MISSVFKKVARLFWLLPAVLLWASFPPLAENTNVFFALAPLLWFARNKSARESFRLWFLNGFLFWIGTLAWMPAIVKNGGPWPLVVLGWAGLAAYCALYFGAFGFLSAKIWQKAGVSYFRRILVLLFAEPLIFAALELLRSRLFGGFAWNHLGVASVNAGFVAPLTIGGVYLATVIAVLVNGTLASIAERVLSPWFAQRGRRISFSGGDLLIKDSEREFLFVPRWIRSIETILPILLAWGIYSAGSSFTFSRNNESEPSKVLRVALVQRNFPCAFSAEKCDPEEEYSRHLRMASLLSPDLIVLPESAFCEFAPFDSVAAGKVASWMLSLGNAKGLLAGGSRSEKGELFNSAALYQRAGEQGKLAEQYYDKVHLVPFGEFIPGDKIFPVLQKLAPVGSCTPGVLKLLDFSGIKIGAAICFEDTDSAQMRALARMGADVLVFMTNDSWFSGSDETEQHAWQAVARAVETGLPVIRVGNSGVTGVVYPSGKASWLEARGGGILIDQAGCKLEMVEIFSSRLPPYAVYGDVPLFAFSLLVLAISFVPGLFRRKR